MVGEFLIFFVKKVLNPVLSCSVLFCVSPFISFSNLSDVGSLSEAKDSVIDKDTRIELETYERKIKRLEAEKKEKENLISRKMLKKKLILALSSLSYNR